jgi:hypothetical protein
LNVEFKVGGKSYSGTVVPGLSSSLGDNRYKVAVKAPISVPLGESEIVLSRPQKERFGPDPLDSSVVKRSSFEYLQLEPVFSDLVLLAQQSGNKVKVIDALSSGTTPPGPQQQLPKDVWVGMPSAINRPGQLAATSNATRAYVPLERSGRVALVDLLARRQVDADASTPAVDDINLPNGASPGAITIDPWDNYGYIADSKRGSIYILDVNPDSASYNQVVETISVDATSGLRQIAISSDGRKLFATAADGYIYAVNIDPEDKPSEPNSNPRKWREQIGKVLTPRWAFGLSATPDPLKMVFTNGNPNTDLSGFGVLTVKDDPLNLAPTTRYTDLTLTNNNNVFEVTEGVAVTVTADGKYAFVAGRKSKKIIERTNRLAGGNIGIIKDPLGPNPQLVAATEPVPEHLTNNVALSSDGKYLIGSYVHLNGPGQAYVFNVEEIIKTVENPDGKDLTKVAVDRANQNIGSHIFASGSNPLGLVVASNRSPYFPNITGPYGVSKYIVDIQFFLKKYNYLLKNGLFQTVTLNRSNQRIQTVAPLKEELDWKWVAAAIVVETNPGTEPGYLRDARMFDPMQIANAGDPALPTLQRGGEATNFLTTLTFRNYLKTKSPTPFNNGILDYKSVPLSKRMDYKTSIEGGVVWLFSRAFQTQIHPVVGQVISGWSPWSKAIEDYNGGGNPNYLSEVRAAYEKLVDWVNSRDNREG